MVNLPYIAYRLLRRGVPPWLTYRLASRDQLPPESLRDDALAYGKLLADEGVDVRGAVILEIGPGTYNPFSLLLLKSGAARVMLVEPFPRGLDYGRLRERMEQFWKLSPDSSNLTPLDFIADDGFQPEYVEFHQGFADRLPCPDGSVDVILSSMMMQFADDTRAVLADSLRTLRPGGKLLHIVDFRDHFFKYPFEMLTFSESTWKRLSPLKGGRGYHNRLRVPDYLRLLTEVGFVEGKCRPLGRDLAGYERVKPRLHPQFRGHADSDMDITVAAVTAVKPQLGEQHAST